MGPQRSICMNLERFLDYIIIKLIFTLTSVGPKKLTHGNPCNHPQTQANFDHIFTHEKTQSI